MQEQQPPQKINQFQFFLRKRCLSVYFYHFLTLFLMRYNNLIEYNAEEEIKKQKNEHYENTSINFYSIIFYLLSIIMIRIFLFLFFSLLNNKIESVYLFYTLLSLEFIFDLNLKPETLAKCKQQFNSLGDYFIPISYQYLLLTLEINLFGLDRKHLLWLIFPLYYGIFQIYQYQYYVVFNEKFFPNEQTVLLKLILQSFLSTIRSFVYLILVSFLAHHHLLFFIIYIFFIFEKKKKSPQLFGLSDFQIFVSPLFHIDIDLIRLDVDIDKAEQPYFNKNRHSQTVALFFQKIYIIYFGYARYQEDINLQNENEVLLFYIVQIIMIFDWYCIFRDMYQGFIVPLYKCPSYIVCTNNFQLQYLMKMNKTYYLRDLQGILIDEDNEDYEDYGIIIKAAMTAFDNAKITSKYIKKYKKNNEYYLDIQTKNLREDSKEIILSSIHQITSDIKQICFDSNTFFIKKEQLLILRSTIHSKYPLYIFFGLFHHRNNDAVRLYASQNDRIIYSKTAFKKYYYDILINNPLFVSLDLYY